MGVIFFIFQPPGKFFFYELNSFQKNPGREERKKNQTRDPNNRNRKIKAI